jgi:UDP-N-acetylglucosamine--N-acetylmuramyl-(pentapeptide) pyrophosphoryl-undecaprenol N-acetylglucosamine transferase
MRGKERELPKKVLILAGGGGHTGYAHILAQEMVGIAELSFLVPDDDPLSRARLEPFGRVQDLIKPRHPTTPFYRFIPRLLLSFLQSLTRVSSDYRVVVSTGSNFCIPPALIAWLKGIPLINIESADKFETPSKTARILQHLSAVTVLQWEEQRKILKGTVFGPFLPRRRAEPWEGGYVLIAAGTYGYEELLEAASESQLKNVVLQTGDIAPERYEKRHPEWRVITTTDRFYELVAGADAVVAPPGATPLEAATYGKPVVIVKYPEWSRAGTLEDARLFAEKLNAPLLSELSPRALVDALEEAKRRDKPKLKNGAKALAEYIVENYLSTYRNNLLPLL